MRDMRLWAHWLAASLLGGALVLAQSCDSGAPAAPPPSTSASAGKGSGGSSSANAKSKDDDDDSSSSGSEEEEASGSEDDDDDSSSGSSSGSEEEEASGSEEEESSGSETASASGSGSPTEPGSFTRPGAQIGDDATKTAVKACIDGGKFYDRIADSNNCLALDLAKVDCTGDGIKAFLGTKDSYAKLKDSFTAKLTGDYAGMEVDQCVDCPPGTSITQCATTPAPAKGGTKVFFARMNNDKIEVRGMMIPVRPFRD